MKQDGSSIYVGDGGAPVGLFSFAEYETIEFELQQNDRLFLFSDGVTECERPDGSLWDEEGLTQMFSDRQDINLQQFPTQLIDKLSSVHGASEFTDDVSGVLINPWATQNEDYNDTIRQAA